MTSKEPSSEDTHYGTCLLEPHAVENTGSHHIMTLESVVSEDDRAVKMTASEPMADDETNKIDDMTRSIMALETCGEVAPPMEKHGLSRYGYAMKRAVPVRFEKGPKEELPMTQAGCLSQMTYSWQTSMMWNIYRKGIDCIDHLRVGDTEKAKPNADRLEKLWLAEVRNEGPKRASFTKAVLSFTFTRVFIGTAGLILSFFMRIFAPGWVSSHVIMFCLLHELNIFPFYPVKLKYRPHLVLVFSLPDDDWLERLWNEEVQRHGHAKASFIRTAINFTRTRLMFSTIFLFCTVSFQFSVPAFILHHLLSYLNSGNVLVSYGIALVAAITALELGRSLTFAQAWFYNYTTGVRMRAAAQSLLYRKILRLRSLQDKTVGELVNLLSNDGQRIFEAVALGPLMIPGPIVLLFGLIYMLFLIGPWALIAIGTYAAFYPFMVGVSKLTNILRRKCIVITDKRVRMMNELLSCIKLVKMYAWEKSFARAIAGVRADERRILEKAAYVQSISSSTAPIVPVMASVFTFLALVLSGNDLSPVDAFTIIAVLNSLRFSLGVLPFAVKALADANVSFKRYKDILLMDEMETHRWQIFDEKYAVVLNKAVFKWEKDQESGHKVKAKEKGETEVKALKRQETNGNPEEREKLKDTEQVTSETDVQEQPPTLRNLTLVVEKGQLVGICGSVGCGKSSLLSAVLGKMVYVSGKIALEGSLAYVSQQAWIMNTTVRENIMFGEEYDNDRYAAVVKACALEEDFSDFISGDQTEIGERGINLSGGQKQRISLARAVYSNRDIFLLDDPLSAVDIHVGRHIFSECIKKMLKGKTVLFVTHQLQYLSQCDLVMFMKDGMITDSGTHDKLMMGDNEYATLIKMFYSQEKEEEQNGNKSAQPSSLNTQSSIDEPHSPRQRTLSQASSHSGDIPGCAKVPISLRDPLRQMSMMSSQSSLESDSHDQSGGKLMVAEELKEGKIGWSVYSAYMRAAGGYIVSSIVLLSFVLSIGAQTFTQWWLSHWLNQGSKNTSKVVGNTTVVSESITDNPYLEFYTTIYGSLIGVIVVLTAIRAYIYMKTTLKASSTMHNDIFRKMLGSTMEFFDTTPVGRIINRFSSDLDEIDVRLPASCEMFIQNILLILSALLMIAYVSPWFLIALVPLLISFVLLNIVFTSGVRELKRMDMITRSPLLSHVTASVQGISTIHAYGKMDHFIERFDTMMDKNSGYFYLFYCSNRWLAVRLDFMSTCVVAITGLCVVLTYDNLTPALAGLALAFAIQITGLFQFTIRQAIETEAKFVAVQRLQYYSEDVPSEEASTLKPATPMQKWPEKGEVKFSKYKMRYRKNLALALKGIGFTIKSQEKVGIVGRSGSGKSSLGVALFRLVEPVSGAIYIDGVDITTLKLEDLRSRLSIIPQDPVLFVGTVRYNLDPFHKHTDDALWEALEKCHVKNTVASLELKLEHLVIENGENFSLGERQLICLARALLRNSKVLMLDEATAAIDTETDALVQSTIKDVFSHCTMLIIAHRLNTVLSCDRILVMEKGKVIEFGRPADLVAAQGSKFKAMLDAVEDQQKSVVIT